MGLIDSHAHLTDESLLGVIGDVLGRARAAGVERMVSIAQTVADAARVIELARRQADVSATAGIPRHQADQGAADDWPTLEALLAEPEVVACGEIGLDYHYDLADRASQRAVLATQLELAANTSLPLVIHCREAFDEVINLLTEAGYPGRPVVFHCFCGTPVEARRVAERGWRASFTGLVTYKSAGQVQEIARTYPADLLMIETDSPYLSPVPMRGTFPNEPANLIHTARFLADLRGEAIDELIERTAANTRDFFGLPA